MFQHITLPVSLIFAIALMAKNAFERDETLIQAASILFPTFEAPPWVMKVPDALAQNITRGKITPSELDVGR